MKNKCKPLSIIVLIIICLGLFGCDTEEASISLSVSSSDYHGLTKMQAGELDKEKAQAWHLDDNPYKEYSCFVALNGDSLRITNDSPPKDYHLFQGNYGYFVGIDLGHWDGWVRYYPYNSSQLEQQPLLVAQENCCGFLSVSPERGYVLTYDYFGDEAKRGKLYELQYSEVNQQWEWRVIVSFDHKPQALLADDATKCIFILTTEDILVVSEDGSIGSVYTSSVLPYIDVNSIIKRDGSLYCGSSMGVYEYHTESQTENWYPMDYEEYVD